MSNPTHLTRREFIKLSGATSLGIALSACGVAPTPAATPAPTYTPLPTNTLVPTATSTPKPAITPTATYTPTPAPTPLGGGQGRIAVTQGDQIVWVNSNGSGTFSTKFNRWVGGFTISPNGKRILYTGIDKKPGDAGYFSYGLYIVDVDVSKEVVLVDSSTRVLKYHWLQNGGRLAFLTDGLYIANLDGSNISRVTDSSQTPGIKDFEISPDGKRIAFSSQAIQSNLKSESLYLMAIDGTGLKKITDDKKVFFILYISWSPDSKYLSFSGDPNPNTNNISAPHYVLNLENRKIEKQYPLGWRIIWSPDGERALIVNDRPFLANLPEFKATQINWAFSRSGSSIYDIGTETWAPNGKLFAVRYGSAQTDYGIYLAEVEKPEVIKLDDGLFSKGKQGEILLALPTVTWSRDSKYLAYIKYDGNKHSLYTIGVGDLKSTPIATFSGEYPIFKISWHP